MQRRYETLKTVLMAENFQAFFGFVTEFILEQVFIIIGENLRNKYHPKLLGCVPCYSKAVCFVQDPLVAA